MHRMADYLGMNTWSLKSAAGATTQNAVDYSMGIPPDSEGVSEQVPNVRLLIRLDWTS